MWTGILSGAALLLGLLAWLLRRSSLTYLFTNLATACFAVALFEAFLAIENSSAGDGTRIEGTINDNFTRPDDTLGYLPNKNAKVTARKLYENSILYDVVYTIGADGLRVSPPHNSDTSTGCAIFFGDSVTFGEGVNDDENYPYLVGLKTDGTYRIHNFAFSGYGPHQMLANLMSGRVAERIRCAPSHVFFLCIPAHIERVAGLTSWDRHGPRFRLSNDGSVKQDGHFDDPWHIGTWTLPKWVKEGLELSLTWQKIMGRGRQSTSADLDLLAAVIAASRQAASGQYPGSQFDVILWDGADRARAIESRLVAAGLPLHLLTTAIPDFPEHWGDYVISPHDMHPNKRLHDRLADYIVSKILRANSRP
jgi:hypothetical protein